MQLTFRTKLLAIVGISALASALLVVTGALLGRRVESQLAVIHQRHLPKLELQPQLDAQFERLRRGFEDAVASRDVDDLAATAALTTRFLERLDAAGTAVDPAEARALRSALLQYDSTAREVSRRVIAGETGEALVAAMADMQAEQADVERRIARTAAFDRQELADAFAAVADTERRAIAYQLWISVSCLVAVLGLSLVLSRGALRTLGEVTSGFARFGAGEFGKPIHASTHDELGEVARHANRMAESLAAAWRERDRAEAALKFANRELEAFSYSVAHDLRAPLRAINGFGTALVEDCGAELGDQAKSHLQRIGAGTQKMAELIDALLALSRVTRIGLRREVVELGALARLVVGQLQANDPRRVVEFVGVERAFVHGDPPLLRALLENLLGNAWKFTSGRASARVEFGFEKKNGQVVFHVRDNGAGFDMAYADKLFVPFQRLHGVFEFAGTGVGLATVQRIVQRHGGAVWAEGVVGEGAAFYFTLPGTREEDPDPSAETS